MQIVYITIAACMMAVWLALAVFGARKPMRPGALAEMRYGPALRSLALALALLGPLIMIYVIGTFAWRSDTRLHLAGVAFLVTSIIMALPLIEVTRVQVVVTDDGLTRFSPWTQPVTLRWAEVERVRYEAANRSFLVEGGGRTIRVSRHLSGIDFFADRVKRKLATATWAGAAQALP